MLKKTFYIQDIKSKKVKKFYRTFDSLLKMSFEMKKINTRSILRVLTIFDGGKVEGKDKKGSS